MSDIDIESKESKTPVIQKIKIIDQSQAKVEEKDADATLKFMEQYASTVTQELTPEIERRIKWKLYIWLVPLIMYVNTVLFIDKSALSYGILLGLFESTKISQDQYNNLNSIFYTGYLVGQVPLHYLLQKFNYGKSVTLILFVWTILVFLTATASNYGGLIVLRFLLGFAESAILPAIEVTLLQFFTPRERSMINPFFWISSVGPAVWIGGFISYGLLFLKNSIPPWKIFMVIIGGLTLIATIWSFLLYPSNPADAKFLTIEERVLLIEKIQANSSSSIEQKTIKKYQIVECLKDPLTWLFTGFGFTSMIHNNLMFQANILYESLGIHRLDITIINVVGGAFGSIYLLAGILLIFLFKINLRWIILFSAIPGLAGSIGMVSIPYDKKLALTAMLILAGHTFALAFITVVGWTTSSAGGYTKKLYRNIHFMFGYCIANIISPQLWRGKSQKPRYYVAWSIQIVISFFIPIVIAFVIHFILSRRNIERKKYIEEHEDERFGQVVRIDAETGEEVVHKVDIANLDLTDLENKFFIYPI